jgi:nicotinate-nucleotide adenylyltransferase
MTAPRRLGVLGGTFDPIHVGHLQLGAAVERAVGLSAITVVPARIPPHRPQPLASGFHRFAMAAMAVAGRPGWRVCDLELLQPTRSYTSVTLERLHAEGYAAAELFFITGADAFTEISTWRDYPGLLDMAHFTVVSRPGHAVADLPARMPRLAGRMVGPGNRSIERAAGNPFTGRTRIFLIHAVTADVSSTDIRQRAAAGESIAGLVHPSVLTHIEQHRLYSPTDQKHRHGRASRSLADKLHGQG